MERADYRWQEVIPGSTEQTSIQVAADSMIKTMTIEVLWGDVLRCISHVIGFAKKQGSALSRQTPAKHPAIPWLRATKILNIQGRLGSKSTGWSGWPVSTGQPFSDIPQQYYNNPTDGSRTQKQGQYAISCGSRGTFGAWDSAYVTILFEAPKYPILEDNQISGFEYNRYVIKKYDTNLESLARKGEIWKWWNSLATARVSGGTFGGDLLLKQAKGMVSWTWMDVPEEFLYANGLLPLNLIAATGQVNLKAFPQGAVSGGSSFTFPPGTLLMLPIKTEPRSQVNPSVVYSGYGGELTGVDSTYFPRTHDVYLNMIHFDPPNDETLVATPNLYPTQSTTVRGHNLVPIPVASTTNMRWYAAQRVPPGNPPGTAVNPVSDVNLLYQYYDFEKIFTSAT